MVGTAPDDVRVLFVVGARRSGTNWLQRLLCMHPDLIPIAAETYLFHGLAELSQRFHHGLVGSANTGLTYLPRDQMIAVFRDLADRAFGAQLGACDAGRTLVERTPWHAHHLDLIAEVYPGAPVVHLIRDGREVAASLVRQPWGPASIEEAAAEWVSTVSLARGSASAQYTEVRHEDLATDVVGAMRSLFTAIGYPATEQVLERVGGTATRLVNTGRGEQASPVGSWQRELTAEQVAAVERVAGPLLTELGYPLSAPGEGRVEPAPAETRIRPAITARLAARRRRNPPAAPSYTLGDIAQWAADRLLEALADRDPSKLAQVLAANAEISFPQARETLTGGDSLEVAGRVVERLDVRGTQTRGDCYGGLETFTMFCTHDDAGVSTHRVFVAIVAPDRTITALTCYQVHGGAG